MTKCTKTLYSLLFIVTLPLTTPALPQNSLESGRSAESVVLSAEANIDFSRPIRTQVAKPPKSVETIIEQLIKCESGGRNVTILDSNNRYSYGVLQFQMSTWNWFSEMSGITGTPLNPEDAQRMTAWAITHGFLGHWTCAKILGLSYP